MSKKDKLLDRLFANPAPTDFEWEKMITLMIQHEFTPSCSGGSHHTFQHVSGYTFKLSKTHPSGILKAYQVRAVREALQTVRRGPP